MVRDDMAWLLWEKPNQTKPNLSSVALHEPKYSVLFLPPFYLYRVLLDCRRANPNETQLPRDRT